MAPTTVGVIGCGKIAHGAHLPGLAAAAAEGVGTVVGVCDLVPEQAQSLAETFGVPRYDSVEALLEKARPEVVSITTPVINHRDLTLQAFEAGCHVLCEKPIAMSLAEAEEMLAAADRADRLLSICLQYRHWEESGYLRERIANGDFGSVHFVRTWGGGVYDFAFHRRQLPGRGALSHWTIHNLDLALWLLGNPEPLNVSAFCHQRLAEYPEALGPLLDGAGDRAVVTDMEDFAYGMVRLENNAVITLEANWLQSPSQRPEGWEILGAKGAASLWPIAVQLDRDGRWLEDSPPAGSLAPCGHTMDQLMIQFLEAVRTGGSPPVTADEVRRIQKLMDALYASADTGHEVSLG